MNNELQTASDLNKPGGSDDFAANPSQQAQTEEMPRAEIEEEEELIGFGDHGFTATNESKSSMPAATAPVATTPAISTPAVPASDVALNDNAFSEEATREEAPRANVDDEAGGLDFETIDEPTLADGSDGSNGSDSEQDGSDDWADVAVADVMKAKDGEFPGALETNARIAGQNLAMQGIESQLSSVFSQSPGDSLQVAKRIEMLADSNREIQAIIAKAPAAERANLIKLAPFNEFTNRFLMKFRGVSEKDLGITGGERSKVLKSLESFAR